MCLSGCLTAYRRSVLLELDGLLEHREILGVPIKYGEDRFLTRQIIKAGYLTTMTHDALCWTNAPHRLDSYFSQQLRWRRSNMMDYGGAISHLWRQSPIIAIHFFSQFAILIAYPCMIVRSIAVGSFMGSIAYHVFLAAIFGAVYAWKVRKLPKEEKVSPLAFLPIAIVLPVTYALLTPVALFTLDSGSWETRDHDGASEIPQVQQPTSVEILSHQGQEAATARAELPAA
jgi:cellulose synthase/poly-beta-1,6-N-acetylglucosamine synthase-like glycosyltransferase